MAQVLNNIPALNKWLYALCITYEAAFFTGICLWRRGWRMAAMAV
jgi:hypothetical protein